MIPISTEIWDTKYRFKDPFGKEIHDKSVEDTWWRVARALAEAESPDLRQYWTDEFYNVLSDYKFLPAGRIVAGAGTERSVTLSNCFVSRTIHDSMKGIFQALTEAALTQKEGGGIGMDFSTLRPKGALVKSVGSVSSGAVSFMNLWDAMCHTIMSAGSRRGAMMATMWCNHPDIEEFVDVKRDKTKMRNFNLSVLVTEPFMKAIENDTDWPLTFKGQTFKTIKARYLWNKMMRNTYEVAEPGVIFIDRINAENNLAYCETINSTNPCGEQPLPPHGACLLGSINLAELVDCPFTESASIHMDELSNLATVAIRMMDNVIEVQNYPLPEQREEGKAKRRLGLGITGLADALAMCQLRYNAPKARQLAQTWMAHVNVSAYLASAMLAAEKCRFPKYQPDYLNRPHIRALPTYVRETIAANGIRNSHLTSIAPTGTISLFANNISSGIEPIFAYDYDRKIRQADGSFKSQKVTDYAVLKYREMTGTEKLPDYFVVVDDLKPADHLEMQAVLQPHVDSGISKTINVPVDITFDDFKNIYANAYALGCKGVTTYRPNDVTGSILSKESGKPAVQEDSRLPTGLIPREPALTGTTYKIKPGDNHALYITINDTVSQDGRRPFEIFFNSKQMDNFQWVVALSRMITAVFRRGGDVDFVVEELKQIFDPCGGHWSGGRFMPSVVAEIGEVINRHLTATWRNGKSESSVSAHKSMCPKCRDMTLVFQEGCTKCLSCDYSKCG